MKKTKLIRTATIALSLDVLLKGQLAYLHQYYDVTAVSGNDKYLENVASREGVAIASVEMERKIAPIKDLLALFRLIQLFRKEKPTIVHSITPKAGLLSMLAAKIAGVPVRIHTFTGLIFPSKTGMMQKILIYMDRLLCAAATHIIPEGNGVKSDLLKYKITNKPLSILANGNVNGIDVDYYNPNQYSNDEMLVVKQQLGISAADYVFCFVGRLVKDKGIQELVQAFDELFTRHPQITLLLVGPLEDALDPLDESTMNLIKKHPKILELGFQKDIRPFVSICDVFVFPSYREGFPNVLLQAGAMGKPAIVTDISGSNEIIVEGRNGHIINSKATDELVAIMDKYATRQFTFDPNKIRAHIVQQYANQLVWAATHAFYQKSLS